MQLELEQFKTAYSAWVEESLPAFRAGKMEKAVQKYPFVVSTTVPWTPFQGEPSEKTIALITSGGLYLKSSQTAFETGSIHGDPSFRALPKTTRPEDLGIAHDHYDHSLAEQDINTIFPLQRLIELGTEGVIARVADTHYSFSYVNDVVPLVTDAVPKVISTLKAEGVDIVFLVPVWPKCHQTVGLIQRLVEASGISTISMGNMPDRMAHIKPPRALLVKFPRGSMLGEPGDVDRQRRIILDSLDALEAMDEPGTVQELPYRWKKQDTE